MELAYASVGLLHVLVGLLVASLLSVQFRLKFAHALFEFGNHLKFLDLRVSMKKTSYLLATLESGGFGFIESDLDLLELLLESLAHAVDVLSVFLLLAQIFGQFGGISDGLLRSLLSAFVFGQGLIEVGLKSWILCVKTNSRILLHAEPGVLPRAFSWRPTSCWPEHWPHWPGHGHRRLRTRPACGHAQRLRWRPEVLPKVIFSSFLN